MQSAFVLTVDDIGRYTALRRLMLETEPHAFAGHPESDGGLDPAMVRARIESGHSRTVAVAGETDTTGELIATAGLFREPNPKLMHRAHIVGVYTHPEHRGRGLGRAVVAAAIEQARVWPETERVCLSVSEAAPEAKSLYESLGFVVWGREPAALKTGGRLYDEIHLQLALR